MLPIIVQTRPMHQRAVGLRKVLLALEFGQPGTDVKGSSFVQCVSVLFMCVRATNKGDGASPKQILANYSHLP
eukprot:3434618-Amphidinium_carterae.1